MYGVYMCIWCHIYHEYISIYPSFVSIYTIHTDPMGSRWCPQKNRSRSVVGVNLYITPMKNELVKFADMKIHINWD